MVDLHWKFEASEAMRLIRRLEAPNLYFAEAPCQPEDLRARRSVARGIGVPLALGEEWRTVYEYRPRLEARCMGVIQPEIGHTGITEFIQIGRMAQTFHINTIPHASISVGIFMAASLVTSSALAACSLSRVPALGFRPESWLRHGRHGLRRWALHGADRARVGRGA